MPVFGGGLYPKIATRSLSRNGSNLKKPVFLRSSSNTLEPNIVSGSGRLMSAFSVCANKCIDAV